MSVNWEANKIYVYYHTNDGTLNTNNANISTDNGYLTLNGNRVFSTFNYGDDIGSGGLANYNNKGWIYVERTGFHVASGAEWKNQDKKTFDQVTNYKASDLCDATKSSCNAIMYVNWTASSYTITFNANGGSVSPSSKTANYNTSITLPTPSRSGYIFNGWYTASSGGSKIGGAGYNYTVTYSATFYAQWTSTVVEHVCNSKARTASTTPVQLSDIQKYAAAWNYDSKTRHWCNSPKKSESCIPTNHPLTIPMYEVTCSICGKKVGGYWCPVHGSGGNATSGNGGKGYPICDADARQYSSDATSCIGKDQGWDPVSK